MQKAVQCTEAFSVVIVKQIKMEGYFLLLSRANQGGEMNHLLRLMAVGLIPSSGNQSLPSERTVVMSAPSSLAASRSTPLKDEVTDCFRAIQM